MTAPIMNQATVLTSFLLLLAGIACAKADSVIDYSTLSPDAFKDEIANHNLILVEFFAPWCGHCKKLAPEYEKAAKVLAGDDPAVPVAKVDCTNENGGKEICSANDVSGFPTLKIFEKGVASDYDDGRDSSSIVAKMRSLAGPPSKELEGFEQIQKVYKEGKELTVIGLFKNADDELFTKFIDTAREKRELAKFVHVFEDKSSSSFDKLTAFGDDKSVKVSSIILTRPAIYRSKFEPDFLVYDSSDILKDWIVENMNGLVRPRGMQNAREMPKPQIIVYYNVDYEKDPKGTNYWRNRVLKVATKNKDSDLVFAISDINQFAGELPEYGLEYSRYTKERAPLVAAVDKDGKKFNMKEKFSVENFQSFVDSFLEGALEQFLKSEDEPEDNDTADVKVAVAKNFAKLVTNSEKDVFIKFYAPWCGHCKSLAPTWEELGQKLKSEPGVDIVKLDATANDIPDLFEVRGFPTLFWYPKDSKTPIKYEGGRDIKSLLSYVANKATDELQGYDRSGEEKKRDEL